MKNKKKKDEKISFPLPPMEMEESHDFQDKLRQLDCSDLAIAMAACADELSLRHSHECHRVDTGTPTVVFGVTTRGRKNTKRIDAVLKAVGVDIFKVGTNDCG